MPMGTVWDSGTWADDAWEDGSWGDVGLLEYPDVEVLPLSNRFIRLDLYSGIRCAGGSALAEIFADAIKVTQSADANDRVEFAMEPGTDAALLLKNRSIIRTVFEDGVADEEYIVTEIAPSSGDRSGLIPVMALPVIPVILAGGGQLVTFGSGGIPSFDDGRTQLTVAEYLDDVLIPFLASRGITWIDAGTITAAALVDYDWNKINPLDWLKGLIGLPDVRCEWRWRRNGHTNYLLDIAPEINSGAAVPQIRTRKNLRSHVARSESSEMANAILVYGAELNGVPAGIEESIFTIADITGTTITFVENCVEADGAWDSKYLMKDAATPSSTQIVTSTYPNQVTLGSVSGFAEGDIVMLRDTSGASGLEVTLLTHPASILEYRYAEAPHSVPDIYGYRNWLKNGGFSLFSAGDTAEPDFWDVAFGSGTGTLALSKETNPAFVSHGPNALKITLTNPAHFLLDVRAKQSFYVHQRTGKSRISVIARVYSTLGVGTLRLNLLAAAGSWGTTTLDGQTAITEIVGTGPGWYTLAIVGFDALAGPRASYEVHVGQTNMGGNDPLYIGAVMVAFSETGDIPFTGTSFGNQLRDAGIARLLAVHEPQTEDTITLLDLSEENVEDVITIGGYVGLTDTTLATSKTRRARQYVRQFERGQLNKAKSTVTLDAHFLPLSRQLVAG